MRKACMRGRKPKPSHMKIVTGNPGRRPLNPDEPKPESSVPTCPTHLSSEARTEWRRICKELESLELLTEIDRTALAAYCQAYGRWAQAEKGIKKAGLLVKTGQKTDSQGNKTGGNVIQSPLVGIANTAMEIMRKYLVEFGMTPSSRSRISVGGKKQEGDKAESYFG